MPQTFNISTAVLFLLLTFLFTTGCSQHNDEHMLTPEKIPEITTAYLLEQRVISYAPKYHEKVISTLPYEIQTFDENYLLFLVARIPDANSTAIFKIKEPHYYLWIERRSESWRDFIAVYSQHLTPLAIKSHHSSIRSGKYYKGYTIDFTLQQLNTIQKSDLTVTLINGDNHRSTIEIPKHYIQAFLQMVELANKH